MERNYTARLGFGHWPDTELFGDCDRTFLQHPSDWWHTATGIPIRDATTPRRVTSTSMVKVMHESSLMRLIREAKRYPLLSAQREQEIVIAWRSHKDRAALDELVGSHLRLVVKIARGFVSYGFPLADLVSEGNVGLVQAAGKFNPERGFRFATYAVWWIRAAIQEYVLRSWSLVKIGTTAAQKRLFFNLRREKARLGNFEQGDLGPETVTAIATNLAVSESEVVDMNRRLAAGDSSLNAMAETNNEWLERLQDQHPSQEEVVGDMEETRLRRGLLRTALTKLNPRERDIILARRLKEEPATLEELSQRYAVSRERVRQIEVRAMSKMVVAVAAAHQ